MIFLVAVVVGKTEGGLARFVDSIDSFGSEAHSTEVVCYGYVSPASFKHLGCCGFEVKAEQFLDQLTVLCLTWIRWNWTFHSLFLICWEVASIS